MVYIFTFLPQFCSVLSFFRKKKKHTEGVLFLFGIDEDSKRTGVNFVPVARKSREPAFPQKRNPVPAATSEQVWLVPIFL